MSPRVACLVVRGLLFGWGSRTSTLCTMPGVGHLRERHEERSNRNALLLSSVTALAAARR